MLYILTGQIQTGKTRWLQDFIAEKESMGDSVYGVVAPGIWRDLGPDHEPRYEKHGIDNELLPGHHIIHFARRRDLASEGDAFSRGQQAAKEKLGWAISDEAIAEVDAHFVNLLEQFGSNKANHATKEGLPFAAASPAISQNRPGLLVVDELGRLELVRGEGLVHAMELLKMGPTQFASDALVVVREDLVPNAIDQLKEAWTDIKLIRPGSLDLI